MYGMAWRSRWDNVVLGERERVFNFRTIKNKHLARGEAHTFPLMFRTVLDPSCGR